MVTSFLRKRKNKERKFLAIDIGTSAVKCAIFKKEKEKDFELKEILSSSFQYLEEYNALNAKDFESAVLRKAISLAIKEVQRLFALFYGREKNDFPVFLIFSPNVLKARVVSVRKERKKKLKISKREEKEIYKETLFGAKEKISKEVLEKEGILDSEICWLSSELISQKIDGYLVSQLSGYAGTYIDVKFLIFYTFRNYLQRIKQILVDLKIKESSVILPAVKGLLILSKEFKENRIFVDIGAETSEIILIKEGLIDKVRDFSGGVELFVQQLTEDLSITEDLAKTLIERYSKRELSQKTQSKIKRIIRPGVKEWCFRFKSALSEISKEGLVWKDISLFGGGAFFCDDIKEVLAETECREMNTIFDDAFNVKVFSPKEIFSIKDPKNFLKNSPVFTPLLLSILSIEEVNKV